MKNTDSHRMEKQNLPNFLIVGAAKSGTTSLYYYLMQHPDIFMSHPKEPCFFSSQTLDLPQKGLGDERKFYTRTYEDYCRLFNAATGKKAVGEASADTIDNYAQTIPLIKKILADPKIIIILRNPIERTYSSYLFLVRDNRESLSFEEALAQEKFRIAANWQSMWHHSERGKYLDRVKAFKKSFSQVKIVLYDDLKANAPAVVQDIFAFLGVAADFQPSDIATIYNMSGVPRFKTINKIFVNKNIFQETIRTIGSFILSEARWIKLREKTRAKIIVKPKMKSETHTYLQNFFHDDILALQDLIGRDLSAWLHPGKKEKDEIK